MFLMSGCQRLSCNESSNELFIEFPKDLDRSLDSQLFLISQKGIENTMRVGCKSESSQANGLVVLFSE